MVSSFSRPNNRNHRRLVVAALLFAALGAASAFSAGTAVGHDGMKVQAELSTSEITPDQFDAIVVVGGSGAITYLMDNEALRNLIVSAARSGKVVAGICMAPAVLAHAGVLRNMKATCYPDRRIVSVLTMNGVDYSERASSRQDGLSRRMGRPLRGISRSACWRQSGKARPERKPRSVAVKESATVRRNVSIFEAGGAR
jgi:hypothetical protein